jgi:hypothetical protein
MRRQVATATQGISLFPFLAVLLCTMGALIVVLVVLNRQSRLQAAVLSSAEAESRRAESEKAQLDAELRRDMAEWRLRHLRESREKTQADLNQERLRLSGVEEHRRQLETRFKQLQQAAAGLDNTQRASAQAHDAEELEKLKVELDSARRKLAEVRARATSHAPAYTVVAYEGPNRTRRRPIYIECANDRVTIQPEGIELSAADFDGPMGPGNPLASAVRAARDHLAALAPDPKSPDAEPYPLFLVRPDGIEAYYAARAAMQSWGADFGYQTVDQDWKLEYPPLDGRLAQIERQAVEEARERLKWLAQMNPGRYGADGERHGSGASKGRSVYHVSPLGGLVREGGPTLRAGSPGRFGGERTQRRRTGSSDGRNGADWAAAGDTKEAQDKRANREEQSALADESGSRARKEPIDNHTIGAQRPNDKASKPRYGDLNDRAASRDSLISGTEMSAQGSAQTDPDTGQTEVQMKVAQRQKEKPRSLAEMRGSNWGLSPAARASNPITRPIHIVCEGDKLLVHPGRPGDAPAIVPLAQRTEDSVDQFVAEVQERIETWGIAGRGLYWRPQLILEVGHSGEGRYSDLEALLADSGFDVKRR